MFSVRNAFLLAVTAIVSPEVICAGDSTQEAKTTAEVGAFLRQHCVRCHNDKKQEGEVRLDDLAAKADDLKAKPDFGDERWSNVLRQVRTGEMPPAKEPRPEAPLTAKFTAALEAELTRAGKLVTKPQPQYGNELPHEPLFDPANAARPAATPARYWRLSPQIYRQYMAKQHSAGNNLVSPFNPLPGNGFKDYALPLTIDEPVAALLWLNAEALVNARFRLDPTTGKLEKPQYKEIGEAFDESIPLTEAKLTKIVTEEFRKVLGRAPTPDELMQWLAQLHKNMDAGGRAIGVRMTLTVLYLNPEVVYRKEVGGGEPDAYGRRMLTPRELTFTLAYALGDKVPDKELSSAADGGKLATREDVVRQVNRLWDDAKFEKPRLLRFFHEYFGYPAARSVFKDEKHYYPAQAIRDTDAFIEHILEKDQNVIAELLASDTVFVGKHHTDPNERPYLMYGLSANPEGAGAKAVPIVLPAGQRAGILTQPSWLIAYSTNFDNHPIARGHWIRERLLGGTIPEIPLNVDAKLPDDKDQTLRQRMHVTRAEYCWRCHRKMDSLGLPFEMFSHSGRYREVETVLDPAAPMPAKSKQPATRDVPVNARGGIDESGDPAIDGPVGNAVELVKKLAASTRVEQVFIRHAFRYWLGRNETLDDAGTLQAAHRAYKESGGSFRAMVVSLLTSDSFLYRTGEVPSVPVIGK
jgi:mono/diheme cytochrome c family protein